MTADAFDTVAIYAPRGRDGRIAQDLLQKNGLRCRLVPTLGALADCINGGIGTVLATEEALLGEQADRLARAIAEQPAWSDLPFVVLTNGATGNRSRIASAAIDRLGNAVLLSRPLHAEDLLRAVASALKARQRQIAARGQMAELQQREAELRESEKKFHAIVDSIDQMIWSALPDGYHDYYNDRWYEFTGVRPGSTHGDAWNGMFHPEDQAYARDLWAESLATGTPYHIEYRLRHRSGRYRWVLGRAQSVRDEGGQIIRWYGSCTDIDEQVRARQTLARSRAELETAVKERGAELIEVMQERDRAWNLSLDLLVVALPDTMLVEVNAAWQRLLGWGEEELIGRSFRELTHPDDLEETASVFARVIDAPLVVPYEFRMRHKDGTYRRFAWTASFDEGKVYASGRDVTEEHEQAAALTLAEDALRQSQKLETIGQLTGGVAHDFNNLLMAIRSNLELLERRLPKDGQLRGYVGNAVQATERGASLTQRMLAFARKQELQASAVDAAELIPGMRDLLERSLGPQIELTIAVDPEVPCALVDPNQLEMAILNLAVNARDAMDAKGTLRIEAERRELGEEIGLKPGSYIRIAVSDTGTGMDADTLAQAMEPFFTTKGVGKGTGLGLSMVHGLASQSGGTFRMASAPQEGTTAMIYLPVSSERSAKPAGASPSLSASPAGGTSQQRQQTILVVDDDMLVLMGTAGLLEDLGHRVLEANSGSEALEIVKQRPEVDLVVTDHAMPNMTGVELAQQIRAIRPQLPIVLATGYAEMPAGAERYIARRLEKPFSDRALQEVIEAVAPARPAVETG